MLFYLLILIPVFTMGISAYIASLYEFIKGDYSIVLLIFSSICIIVTSYILPRIFFTFFKPNTNKQLNIALKMKILSSYVFYILAFLFTLAFAYKNTLTIREYLPLYLSYSLVIFSIYFIYVYFVYRKTYKFKVIDVKKINKNTYLLKLGDDEYKDLKYYVSSDNYEIGKAYKFKFNKNTKLVLKECK